MSHPPRPLLVPPGQRTHGVAEGDPAQPRHDRSWTMLPAPGSTPPVATAAAGSSTGSFASSEGVAVHPASRGVLEGVAVHPASRPDGAGVLDGVAPAPEPPGGRSVNLFGGWSPRALPPRRRLHSDPTHGSLLRCVPCSTALVRMSGTYCCVPCSTVGDLLLRALFHRYCENVGDLLSRAPDQLPLL